MTTTDAAAGGCVDHVASSVAVNQNTSPSLSTDAFDPDHENFNHVNRTSVPPPEPRRGAHADNSTKAKANTNYLVSIDRKREYTMISHSHQIFVIGRPRHRCHRSARKNWLQNQFATSLSDREQWLQNPATAFQDWLSLRKTVIRRKHHPPSLMLLRITNLKEN